MNQALNDAKYSYLTGRFDNITEIITGFVERVIEFLVDLLFNVDFAGFGAGVNTNIVSGIFVALSIIILGLLAFIITRIYLKRKRAQDIGSQEIFDDFRSNILSFDEIMSLAIKHDDDANFKEAVRYRYIGLIMLFNSKEIVSVTDSMTGAQFERQVAKNTPLLQEGVKNTINM